MKLATTIASIFPEYLFWDVDIKKLDVERDSDLIIPRALYMTNRASFENDIKRLESIYNSKQILTQLKNTKEKISNEICELVASRYHVPVFYRFKKVN